MNPPSRAARRSKEILCTLGPASLNDGVIARLEELGATLFRINLSHTALDELAPTIRFIRERTDVPICLDTEGAQIRTGNFVEPRIEVRENATVRAHLRRVPGDPGNINFYPDGIVRQFETGDIISIDFNAVLVQVVDVDDDGARLRVLTGGVIGANRAVNVERDIAMPALTEKDVSAIAIGVREGIRHIALSFANGAGAVDAIRAVAGTDAFIISKIECRNGLRRLPEIMARSDALLIDRGDLARQVPIERIPKVQKDVIGRAKAAGTKVFVATNLLESMVSAPVPTRAEINDIYNTLVDGADGLVLAAETAIGAYPIHCASMIVRMIDEFENGERTDDGRYYADPVSLLVPPHGGKLVHREASADDIADVGRLPTLEVSRRDLMDCEQIALGTYSPLTGFMTRENLEAVLDETRLCDGTPWTLPIVLPISRDAARTLGSGDRLALTDASSHVRALLDVTQVFPFDFESLAEKWFGTASVEHPGVARLGRGGDHLVAGDVLLVERLPSPYRHYELTPVQTRFVFAHKGWSRVVGFHTRNPVHRVHEHIQLKALETTRADGLYVSPVIGPKKRDDFLPEHVLQSYQLLLDFGVYPKNKVVLGSFATYSRFAGPREAVFTALCRKNMGCSHFIVGRDHTGVADFYPPDANRAMFERLGDIGVAPVFFEAIGYNAASGRYEEATDENTLEMVSGTAAREHLRAGRALPDWFMRPIVQESLRADIAAGRPVFSE